MILDVKYRLRNNIPAPRKTLDWFLEESSVCESPVRDFNLKIQFKNVGP